MGLTLYNEALAFQPALLSNRRLLSAERSKSGQTETLSDNPWIQLLTNLFDAPPLFKSFMPRPVLIFRHQPDHAHATHPYPGPPLRFTSTDRVFKHHK